MISALYMQYTLYVVSTQPQILGTDATIDFLDCTFCVHYLVSKEVFDIKGNIVDGTYKPTVKAKAVHRLLCIY